MIKLFSLLIILISCNAEVNYKDLSIDNSKDPLSKFELLNFNPQVEMMIIFLWPKDLGPKDEKEVIEIIKTSRKISSDKESYLKNLFELNLQYVEKNCDCHSLGICEDDQEMNDDIMLECDEISEKQDRNNLVLANLTLDHEKIKDKLATIKAINIDVGVDDEYPDIGTYDISTRQMILNKFGYKNREQTISFQVSPYRAPNLKAKFIFNIDSEVFSGDLGISNKQYNLIFSGEIKTSNGQRGLIYWEHLK